MLEDTEKEMAIHSSTLAWKIPWTKEPDRLQSMGLQRVRHDFTFTFTFTLTQVKVLHSICQQIWKTHQWPQDWKRSVFIPIPKKGNAKECSSCRTNPFISHASKVILKILQVRLRQYVNRQLPDIQAGFRKGRRTRGQIANIDWIIKKARESKKNIYFCFIDYAKASDCVDHNKLWKILQDIGMPDHFTCLLRNL